MAAVAVIAVGLVPTGKAKADPSLADARKNVASLSKQMEVTTEQYNDAREDLKASKAKVAALEPRAKQLRSQLGGYENKLAEFAGSAYYGGRSGAFSALLQSGSPQTFLDQVAFLQYLSGEQRADLNVLLATKKQFDTTKSKVDAELAKQVEHEQTLRTKRTAIIKDLTKWQQLRAKLGGGSADVAIAYYDGPASGRVAAVLKFAYAQQGKPYEWGADGPGSYDCSGFTMRSWAEAGVSMPHSARKQMASFPRVSTSALEPGDLVFYGSPPHHVALYIGNGKVLHAPQSGSNVRIDTVAGAGGSAVSGAVRPS
jgi:cell wall-associated NlpC family hydrolase